MARWARVVVPGYAHYVTQRASVVSSAEPATAGSRRSSPRTTTLPAGRPLGSRAFVEKLQALLGRTLLPPKRGPKPKDKHEPKRD